jgi:O-antigen/teichoic acid export membrane protein
MMSDSAIDKSDSTTFSNTLQPHAAERDMLLTAKGGGITFAGKLFSLASRFVIAFILARLLGAGQYGSYNLALSALGVATGLALFGLDTALVRYIPVFVSRRDEAGLWGTLQLGIGISTIVSILLGAGLFIAADPIAKQLFHEPNLTLLLRVVSFIIPFFTLGTVAAAATQGFKKMQYAALTRDIVPPLMRVLLVVGLAIVGLNAVGALVIFFLTAVTSAVMALYFLNKLFSLRRSLRTAHRNTKEIFRFSISVYLTDLMLLFQENVQTLLLGALNTMISVGRFAIASQLNLIGSMFQGSITTAARPIIAELHDRGAREQMGHMYQTASKWIFAFNLPLFLILVLFPAQILSLFGKGFVEGSTALVLLTCGKMVDISTGMCGAVIDMTGYTLLKLINAITQFALSMSLSILLIPRWGIIGAAVAALIGISGVNLLRLVEVFILFRLLPYNMSYIKPITAGFVALVVLQAVNLLLPFERHNIHTAIGVVVLIATYIGMILVLGLAPEDRAVLARMWKRLAGRLPRR